MEEDKIRQQARKLINKKYPHLPFDQWGYFEDMFINGWKQALSIADVVERSEQLADDKVKFERKSKPMSKGSLSHPNING